MKKRQLLAASGIILGASLLSKILGFVREATLADRFGATGETDAYLVATVVPVILFAALSSAVATTFIPVFTQRLREGRQQAEAFLNSVLTAMVLLTGVLWLFAAPATGAIIRLVAPGFSQATAPLAAALTREMLPLMLALGVSSVMTGALQAHDVFGPPAFVGVPQNLFIIASIILLGPVIGIRGVAIGTVVGAFTQVLVQWPALHRLGYRLRPRMDLRDPGLRMVAVLALPVLLGSAANQIGTVVDRMLASGLAEGSISALNYGSRLYSLPVGLFVVSLVTVLYPTMARHAAASDSLALRQDVIEMSGWLVLTVAPMIALLIALRTPMVRLLFQHGSFNAVATSMTSVAVLYFSLGMVGAALGELFRRAFFALQDTRTPMYVGIGTVALNVVLNLLLVRPLAHGGLALSLSLSGTAGAAALLVLLRRRLGGLNLRALGWTLAAAAVASGFMGWAASWVYSLAWTRWPGMGAVKELMRLTVAGAAALALYGILLIVLGLVPLRTLRRLRPVRRLGRPSRSILGNEVSLVGSQTRTGTAEGGKGR